MHFFLDNYIYYYCKNNNILLAYVDDEYINKDIVDEDKKIVSRYLSLKDDKLKRECDENISNVKRLSFEYGISLEDACEKVGIDRKYGLIKFTYPRIEIKGDINDMKVWQYAYIIEHFAHHIQTVEGNVIDNEKTAKIAMGIVERDIPYFFRNFMKFFIINDYSTGFSLISFFSYFKYLVVNKFLGKDI